MHLSKLALISRHSTLKKAAYSAKTLLATCQVTCCHDPNFYNVHLIKNIPPFSQQASVQSPVPLSANGMAMLKLGCQHERFHNNAIVFRDVWMVLTLGYYIHVQYSSNSCYSLNHCCFVTIFAKNVSETEWQWRFMCVSDIHYVPSAHI
jgi:hypothetical protein